MGGLVGGWRLKGWRIWGWGCAVQGIKEKFVSRSAHKILENQKNKKFKFQMRFFTWVVALATVDSNSNSHLSSDIILSIHRPANNSRIYNEASGKTAHVELELSADGKLQNLELTLQVDEGELTTYKLNDDSDFHIMADVHKLIPGNRSVSVALRDIRNRNIVAIEEINIQVVDAGVKENLVGAEVDVMAKMELNGGEEWNREAYFEQVYRYKIWSAGGELGADSGPGSNVEVTTNVRRLIRDVVLSDEYYVKRIIDVPCGDLTWMEIDFLVENEA